MDLVNMLNNWVLLEVLSIREWVQIFDPVVYDATVALPLIPQLSETEQVCVFKVHLFMLHVLTPLPLS